MNRIAAVPKPWMDAAEVAEIVARLAGEIDRDHPDGVVLIGVLKGSLFFLADLARAITVPCEVDFIAISHFAPDSGRVRIVKDLEGDIAGRSVVVVEDVVDTGLTLSYLLGQLRARNPASLAVCALLDRSRRRIAPLPKHYSTPPPSPDQQTKASQTQAVTISDSNRLCPAPPGSRHTLAIPFRVQRTRAALGRPPDIQEDQCLRTHCTSIGTTQH